MPDSRPKRSISHAEKWLYACILAFVLLVLAGLLYVEELNRDPVVAIPTPVMPSPNAHDAYLKAAQSLKDPDHLISAFSAKYPRRAKIVEALPPGTVRPAEIRELVFSREELNRLVAMNAAAVTTLQAGFTHPYQAPPSRSIAPDFRHYSEFRQLARFLALRGAVAELHGDHDAAMGSYLDGVQFGATMQRGGPITCMLVGAAIEAIQRVTVWQLVPRLTAPAARAAARRLEGIHIRRIPYATIVQEEKWSVQASLLKLFAQPNWREGLTALDEYSADSGMGKLIARAKLATLHKRAIMRHYTQYMDAAIAQGKQPYARARLVTLPQPKDPISRLFTEATPNARMKILVNDTQNGLLLLTLALHAYRRDHGAYPAALTALAPAYLTTLPDDPFAATGTFRYRRTASGYLLYSLGPDCKDDGGTPSATARTPRTLLSETSTGDVVAGVNIY